MPFLTDPSIALQGKPIDYGQILAQSAALRNANLQAAGQQFALARAGQDFQDQQGVRAAVTGNTSTDPNTGLPALNQAGFLGQVAQTAPGQYLPLAQQLTVQRLGNAKMSADIQKTQLENLKAHTDYMSDHLQGILSQPTPEAQQQAYTNSRNQMIHDGVIQPGSPNDPGPTFDPNIVARQLAQTVSQKDAIAVQQKQQELDETKRRDDMNRNLKNQATAILAKPEGLRTPDEVAFLNGYGGEINMSDTTPGVIKAQARPVQVADPTTPGGVVYTSGRNAIAGGLSAPAGIKTQAPLKMGIDATSGGIGDNINALNTGRGHLNQLMAAAAAMKNGNLQVLNKIANAYGLATGNSAPAVYEAIKNAASGEVAKAFTGSGATVSEIDKMNESFSKAGSPGQMYDVANTYKHMLGTKEENLQGQVQQGMKGQANFKPDEPSPTAPPDASKTSSPTPQTHSFSVSGWQKTNPKGNVNAAIDAAKAAGYTVKP